MCQVRQAQEKEMQEKPVIHFPVTNARVDMHNRCNYHAGSFGVFFFPSAHLGSTNDNATGLVVTILSNGTEESWLP